MFPSTTLVSDAQPAVGGCACGGHAPTGAGPQVAAAAAMAFAGDDAQTLPGVTVTARAPFPWWLVLLVCLVIARGLEKQQRT
jgi:hypothetical protein